MCAFEITNLKIATVIAEPTIHGLPARYAQVCAAAVADRTFLTLREAAFELSPVDVGLRETIAHNAAILLHNRRVVTLDGEGGELENE